MRTITRFAAAILAAIGLSAPLVAAPAASWVNFADTTIGAPVTGARQYTLTSENGYTITVNGTPNDDGSVTLRQSTANTNNTGIVLTGLGALSGTKMVSVMLDIGNLPATTTELLAINLNDAGAEVELKRVVENDTSTIQQQWANSNREGALGNATWTPTDRQILTLTYSGGEGTQGTATYLNGSPLITNVDGLKTIYTGISRIGIGENSGQPATGMKVYGIYLFTSKLTAAEVLSETAAAAKRTAEVSRAANWSDLTWTPSAPMSSDSAVLQVAEEENTLTLDNAEPISLLGLFTQGTGSLTFDGSGSLSSTTTSIATDTDVSAITANLGSVTVASGKTLTVGVNTSASSWALGGSTLATKGDFTTPEAVWGALIASTAANRPAKLLVESGTLALKADTETDKINYAVEVAPGATLDINGVSNTRPSSLTLGEGATLCNGGNDTSTGKIQWTNLVLAGNAKLSGNTFASIASSWGTQSLTLGGNTLTVEMNDGKIFYLSSAGARKSAEEPDAEAGTVKVTSGTLSLYESKNDDSLKRANVVLAGGTLKVDGKGLLGSLTGTSGTLNLNGKDVSIGNLNENRNDDFSGVLTGATGSVFRKVGKGTQTLSGDLSGFAGTYQVDDGTLELPVAGDLTATVAGSGALKKSGAGTLTLLGSLSGTVELAAGTLDMAALRPAVTVTGAETTLMLSQDLDDETVTPISLSFAEGIESCTVVTKNLSGTTTKTLTVLANEVTDGTVNVTFPTESGTVDDTLPRPHRTCGFEDSSLTGLSTSGMQSMTFTPSPFPGQGNYGQISASGRPHSSTGDPNGFVTATDARGFTFSLKVCPNNCADKGVLLALGQQQSAMVALLWQNDSTDATKGRFAVFTNENTSVPVVTSQLVTKTAWHAVSVVSSLETKRVYITVDGEMTKSAVRSTGLSITNGAFQIGSVHAGKPSAWGFGDGAQVDDFRFDKVPLTQAQIARLLFHYAAVNADSTLTGLTEFGSGTQVAWAALKATADARISVDEGVTATATLTAPTVATLKVWGAGTLEVAKGESAQTIAAVELKEANSTLLLHRSQAKVVTSRVGTVGTFKFVGGTENDPLVVPYDVAFPGAIAVAADSCVKLECTGSGNVSYRVSGAGQSSKVILTSDHPWGVLDTGSVTSIFNNLTLSIGGDRNFWIRAGLTDNVWLEIQSGRTVTQEADAPGTNDGVLTVRNLTGGGTFTTSQANKTLRLLNTDAAASEYSSGVTINTANSNKLVFAGKWTVPNAITTAKYPATVEIGDGSTKTDVQLQAKGNARALTVAANATLEVATGTPTAEAMDTDTAEKSFSNGLTLTNNGTLKLTSGYTYINVTGEGKTVVPADSTFVFGIGGDNNTAPFTNSLTVEAEGDAKGELQLRTFIDATLTVPTLVLNGKLTKTKSNTPTIKVTSTGTLASGSTLGEGVALTVAEEATCTLAGPTIDYHADAVLKVDGELSVTETTTAYRQVVGAGTISVAAGKTLTLGRDSATGKTGLVAGVEGFSGTLEVANTAILNLPNHHSTLAYTVENCDVAVNGTLSGGAKLTIAAGKTLSGTGKIAVPVTFENNATATMDSEANITFGSTLTVPKDVTLPGTVTLATGATLSGLGKLSGTFTCQSGATVEAGPTLSGSVVTFADGAKLLAKLTYSPNPATVVRYTLQCASTPTFGGTVKISTPGYDLSVIKAPGLELSKFVVDEMSEKKDIQLRLVEDALMTFCKPVITGTPDNMTDEEEEILSERITNQFLEAMKAQYGMVGSPTSASADPAKPNAKVEGALLFEHVVKLGYVENAEGTYDPVALVSYDFGVSDITVKRVATATTNLSAQLYVVVCAKVERNGGKGAAAEYADSTTVSLLLNNEPPVGVVTLTSAADFTALGIEASTGEKWFAVPMENLTKVTNNFTVKATK